MPRVAIALGLGLVVIGGVGCGPRAGAPALVPASDRAAHARGAPPRLLPPAALDVSDGPSAVYRTAVALQLQPSWAQFLDDCRLRLPADHPLNDPILATTADLVVGGTGQVVSVRVRSSGNADFDRAVQQVIADAVPLPRPPRELWSDDDQVYLRWLFARDRRQAGPATAVLESRPLPVTDVVRRLLARRELAWAARRIQREPAGSAREVATGELMLEALRESLESSDSLVRRAALEAIATLGRAGRVGGARLAPAVREVLAATSDLELRAAALAAIRALDDRGAIGELIDQLRVDLRDGIALAIAEVEALVALGAEAEVAQLLRAELDGVATPSVLAVQALVHVPVRELSDQVARWMRASDAGLRAAACGRATWPDLVRGLRDRDAKVRLRCTQVVLVRPRGTQAEMKDLATRLAVLASDRDASVREQAVRVLAQLGVALPDRHDDPAPGVRAAYAHAIGLQAGSEDATVRVTPLLDDRSPEVRVQALAAYIAVAGDRARVAAQVRAALRDPAAEVRAVAVTQADESELARLATSDDDAAVRTEALVQLVRRRGRASSSDLVLARLAEAAPGSGERVRAALAWLLAR